MCYIAVAKTQKPHIRVQWNSLQPLERLRYMCASKERERVCVCLCVCVCLLAHAFFFGFVCFLLVSEDPKENIGVFRLRKRIWVSGR